MPAVAYYTSDTSNRQSQKSLSKLDIKSTFINIYWIFFLLSTLLFGFLQFNPVDEFGFEKASSLSN